MQRRDRGKRRGGGGLSRTRRRVTRATLFVVHMYGRSVSAGKLFCYVLL
jgi:hypothetical protein